MDNSKRNENHRYSVSLPLVILSVAALISGSTTTMNVYATQTLPTCTDPTGQNLPCIMFISTLPPPMHTLQCQETSGQIFKCTFSVDKLSNGNRIVAITVYVPTNFVVSGTESFRVVKVRVTVSIHTTYSCQKGYHDVIIDGIHECVPNPQEHTREYLIGLKYGTMDGQVGIYDLAAACGKYHGTAFDHCSFGYRTAYVTNCLDSKFGCGDGPTTLPEPTSHASNFTATTPTSGNNFTVPASGGKGTGSTCAAGNCTTGTTPATVDCTKNPTDPSCTQTLMPSTTSPTTKPCPDGSQPDSSGKCPTTQSPTTSNPNTSTPPPSGGSSNNDGGGDGSSSKSGGNSGNGGSAFAGRGGSAFGGNGGNGGSGGNGGNANGRNG
jgi:uncharacterized membrane protein YgcG